MNIPIDSDRTARADRWSNGTIKTNKTNPCRNSAREATDMTLIILG